MRQRTTTPRIDGLDIPPEFLDREAPVWHNDRAYREFMEANAFDLDTSTRLVDDQERSKEMARQGAQISPDPFTHHQWELPSPFARRRWAMFMFAEAHDISGSVLREAGISP